MADDKNKQGQEDRGRVSGSDDYEIRYLAAKMNVSADAIKAAISAVGNSREKIAEYLRGR